MCYNKGDKTLTENSKIGEGFLAKLCEEWEHEAKKSSCRNVQLRFGIVLDNNSRTLTKLLPIFENGAVVNLTASRISGKDMRKIRVFENKLKNLWKT